MVEKVAAPVRDWMRTVSCWSDRSKALVLCGLALLIYGFGIGREFVFDDILYISQNPLLRRDDAFRVFWFSSEPFNYYPLFWSLLRVQWLLWGNHVLGYHLVTLLVHCANAVLVWRVGRAWHLPGAWWIGALFAVHPVNVQTVAWAAEQKNTWSFLFMALALLAFLKHAQHRDWRNYGIALVCFLAALACKTSVAFLPVFLAICTGFRGQKRWRVPLGHFIPFFIASAAAGSTTLWFEQKRAGAHSLMASLSFWQRMETAGAAFWFYLEKALAPIHLTPMYRGWVDTTAGAHTAVPALLLVVLLAACACTWRRIGAPIALGVGYYALMLLPFLGIFDTNYFAYSLIADHWQYHALPGVLVAAVTAMQRLAQLSPHFVRYRNAAGALTVAAAAMLASAHFAHFENARTLWTYVVERNPNAWIAWYNLGNEHADRREYREAIAAYRESIRIKPDSYATHFNLANMLAATNHLEEADREYCEARTISPNESDDYVNRGVVLLRMGREDEAIAEFSRALELEPQQPSAEINLVAIHLRHGRVQEAWSHLHAAALRDDANSRRIADAITANSLNASKSSDVLKQFAARACALSGGQRDLRAAVAALQQQEPD